MSGPGAPRGGGSIDVRGLTWTPLGASAPVLAGLDLDVAPGERVLLAGASGAGKSTLLRALAGVLTGYAPGELTGTVLVDGEPAGARPGAAGLLMQNPRDQIVAGSVGRDVAFGGENTGVSGHELRAAVAEALRAVLLDVPSRRPSTHLSGGEGQRLALAGLFVLGPRVLLLDEPTSLLDAESAAAVRAAVLGYAERTGAALVVVEHDLAPWWPHVDRVVVLAGGRVAADGAPATLGRGSLVATELWFPGAAAPDPVALPAEAAGVFAGGGGALLTGSGVGVRGRLAGGDAVVSAGRLSVLTGPSGAGKTTLLRALTGWVRPTAGSVEAAARLRGREAAQPHRWRSRRLAERIATVVQSPAYGFVANSVWDEVVATPRLVGRLDTAAERRATALLEAFGLARYRRRNPHSLSGGEQRRLALAAALAAGTPVLALDEPTAGQDRAAWAVVTGALDTAARAGAGIVACTHDPRLTARADAETALAHPHTPATAHR